LSNKYVRRLPVRPTLDGLKSQAEELLAGFHAGDVVAVNEFSEWFGEEAFPANSSAVTVEVAQQVLARSYQNSDWIRLRQAAELSEAIWSNDLEAIESLLANHPGLLHEETLIRTDSNWGPPMTYAANLGRDAIIELLNKKGARDHRSALDRAILQGQIGTATLLYRLLGSPPIPDGALAGPAYTLSAGGTKFALEIGAKVTDEMGRRLAPVDVVLQTDGRDPAAKHTILELYAKHGLQLPDTPVMALHRGRIDLLKEHLRRDPQLLTRCFRHRDIYPVEMGCGDPIDATVGTPLDGTTLLHMSVEFDEMEIALWLLDQGMNVNIRSEIGRSGFGGYTALFHSVVSQPNFWMNYQDRGPFEAPFTKLLLERGADPNLRASIWKRLHPGHGDSARYEYRDVTALSWGRRFHAPIFVSTSALAMIERAGGRE
jgi:ankyrin repeat protein